MVLDEAVAVADQSVAVGGEAVTQAESLLAVVSDRGFAASDGAVNLSALAEAQAALAALPLADLEAAVARLAAIEPTWMSEVVREGRRDAVAVATEAVKMFETLEVALDVPPAFLGAQ